MMKCTSCGHNIPDDSLFCPDCGSKTTAPVSTCRQCQAPLKPDARFCDACGAAVASAVPACPSCSSPVKPDTVFCPNCGTNLKQTAAGPAKSTPAGPAQASQQPLSGAAQPAAWQPPAAPQAAYQQQVPPQTAYQQQVPPHAAYQQQAAPRLNPYQQSAYGQPAYAQAPGQPTARPKKSKGLVVALIVLLVVLIGGGAAFLVAGKEIKRLLLGPKASYLVIEGKALEESTAELVADLVKLGNRSSQEPTGGADMEIKLALDAESLALEPVLATLLENLSLRATTFYDRTGTSQRSFAAIDLLTQSERLLTLELFMEEDRMVLGMPDVFSRYVVADQEQVDAVMGSIDPALGDSSAGVISQMLQLDLGIDETAMNQSVMALFNIMLKHIDKVEFEKDQILTAGSVAARYDLYTVTLSSTNARKMMLELLDTLRQDKEIYNIVSKISALAASIDSAGAADIMTVGETMSFDEYQAVLEEMIQDIEDTDPDENPFTMIQKVYVDRDDNVRGRDLTLVSDDQLTEVRIQSLHPVSGSDEAILFSFDDGTGDFRFIADYTVTDNKKSGTASLSADGEKLVDLTYTDYYEKALNGRDFLFGNATLSMPDAGLPGDLLLSAWEESGRYWLELGMEGYGSLQIGYREIAGADARIPAIDEGNLIAASDTEALYSLIDQDAMDKLMAIAEKLGLADLMYTE